MKRFFIQLLAFSLIAQPLLASPFIMQSMRSHQSMAAMRAVLNNQKQNFGIFNKNVQKRHFAEITPEGVNSAVQFLEKCGPYGQAAAGGLALALLIKEHRDKKKEPVASPVNVVSVQPPPTIRGFDLSEGYRPGDAIGFTNQSLYSNPTPTSTSESTITQHSPIITAPSAPSSFINPGALSNDGTDRQAAEAIVGGIIKGGEVAGKAVHKAAEVVAALNPNPLETPGSSGGITMGDAAGGVMAVGTAAEKTAEVVAHKTLWGLAKGVVGPYAAAAKGAIIAAGEGAVIFATANPITAGVIGATLAGGGGWGIYKWWTTPASKAPSAPVSPAVTHAVQQAKSPNTIAAQGADPFFPFELNEREEVKSADSFVAKNQGGGGSGGTPNIDPEKDPEKKDIITRKDPLPTHNVSQMGHIFRKKDGHLLPGPESRSLLRGLVRDAKNFVLRDDFGRDWYAKVLEDGSQLWAEVKNGYITNGGLNEVAKACNRATGFKSGPKGI